MDLNSIQTELNDEFEEQIRIYKEKLSDGIDKDSANSGIISSVICGTSITGGGVASAIMVNTAVTTYITENSWLWWGWYKLVGGSFASIGLAAFATVGLSIGLAYLTSKLCDKTLKNKLENRIPEITNEFLEKMLKIINDKLNDFKSSFIRSYREYIDDFIEQNNNKINDIELVLSDKDSEKIESLKEQVNEAKALLESSVPLVKMLQSV